MSGVQTGKRSFTVIFWPFLSFLLSRLSALPLASPGRCWPAVWLAWDCIGWGWLGAHLSSCWPWLLCWRSLGAGAGRCPLLALRPFPLLGAGSGLWCCCLPLSSLLGAGVPLLSSGAGLLCAGAGCWPWVGVGAGAVQAVPVAAGWGWCALIWRALASSCCTNTSLQIWLLFKGKAINFERFFLDFAHKVRYNNTRVKEIVNPSQLTASPLLGGGRTEERNQLINLKGDRQK